ncbi:MAG: RnfABCDGE type electron transport complex subunit B [Candidatus Nitrotoga sp.]
MIEKMIEKIDAILPQTQCRQCTFPGCKPYATAIAECLADINQCPPGGEEGIRKLADLLGVDFKPFAADVVLPVKSVAFIDESACIGCALCIEACPVDAIVGAAKQMHTVISSECTGCVLCIAPCPVDCISMIPIEENPVEESAVEDLSHPDINAAMKEVQAKAKADIARRRYEFRLSRIEQEAREKAERLTAHEQLIQKMSF